jgi:16S rRNA (guanine527-N7)-methyltransferase
MSVVALKAVEVDAGLRAAGMSQDESTTQVLTNFLNLLREWNRIYNLTGVHENADLVARHLVESLALAPLLEGDRIADVGSGGGLPGIPLAICAPQRRFTLIESRVKKVRFLRHAVATLRLTNAAVAHCRAEDLPEQPPFATVLARAVARPAQLIEIVRPLTAPGGIVLLLTSAELAREYEGIATDFAVRRPSATGKARLRASIVVLERTQPR